MFGLMSVDPPKPNVLIPHVLHGESFPLSGFVFNPVNFVW
jgi:hypothetical protein